MPNTDIVIYQEKEGDVPLLDWLDNQIIKVQDKCIERVERLWEHGYELRRPHADILDDGIYELRVRHGNVNYRILYAFAGKNVVLLSHGCTKTKTVPKNEIRKARDNYNAYILNPEDHTYLGEL